MRLQRFLVELAEVVFVGKELYSFIGSKTVPPPGIVWCLLILYWASVAHAIAFYRRSASAICQSDIAKHLISATAAPARCVIACRRFYSMFAPRHVGLPDGLIILPIMKPQS